MVDKKLLKIYARREKLPGSVLVEIFFDKPALELEGVVRDNDLSNYYYAMPGSQYRLIGKVYKEFSSKMVLRFHPNPNFLNNDLTRSRIFDSISIPPELEYEFPLKEFCEWTREDAVLESLEGKGYGYVIPEGAKEFLRYVAGNRPLDPQPKSVNNWERKAGEIVSSQANEPKQRIFCLADCWASVSLILSTKGITVNIKGQSKLFSPEEFKKIIPKKKSREFLYKVIHANGVINKEKIEGPAKKHLKAYVSHLRGTLKILFGINENPLRSNGDGGYQAMFKTSFEDSSVEQREVLPETNTPKEISRQIDLNPPDDYIGKSPKES